MKTALRYSLAGSLSSQHVTGLSLTLKAPKHTQTIIAGGPAFWGLQLGHKPRAASGKGPSNFIIFIFLDDTPDLSADTGLQKRTAGGLENITGAVT